MASVITATAIRTGLATLAICAAALACGQQQAEQPQAGNARTANQVAAPSEQAHHAARNASQTERSISNLSASDRKCLPEGIKSNADAKEFMRNASDEERHSMMQCLSADGRFEMALLQDDGATLTRAEQQCSLQAFEVLRDTKKGEGATVIGAGTGMNDQIMLTIAVMTYCTRDREFPPPASTGIDADNDETRQILICLVEQDDSPGAFVREHAEGGNLLLKIDEATRGLGPCAVPG